MWGSFGEACGVTGWRICPQKTVSRSPLARGRARPWFWVGEKPLTPPATPPGVLALAMVLDEKNPIPAPGDVAGDCAQAWDVDRDCPMRPPAWHVVHRYLPVRVQGGGDDTHRRFNPVLAWPNASEVGQRDHQSDGP